jgi:hemerythrin-like domain-containing protein
MCEHCGCRGIEPIADLMDEHYEILDIAGDVRRLLAAEDRQAAATRLAWLGQRLGEHVDREERGVFAALKSQDEFVEAVLELEAEHVDFDAELDLLDVEAPDFDVRVTGLLRSLSHHVDQENLGIFPVASVTLGAAGWDMVAMAHAPPDTAPETELPDRRDSIRPDGPRVGDQRP